METTAKTVIHNYEPKTIFDREKTEFQSMTWRGGTHLDNRNKIVNNNTNWRIMNVNKPNDNSIPPLEEMGVNQNKWNKHSISYENGFKGIIVDAGQA